MKLAIVTRAFPPDVTSGRETVIYNLWRQAVQQDDVTLISGWRYSPRYLPAGTLPIDQSSASRIINYARFFFTSALLIRRLRPDVVLSNAIELGPVAVPAAVIVYDLNFGQADAVRGKQQVRRTLVGWRVRCSDAVIAISHVTEAQIRVLGVVPNRIRVIYPGVDLAQFCPAAERRSESYVVICPGRILPGKGQHVALAALGRVPPEVRRRVQFVIVGYMQDGAYLSRLRELAVGLPVEFHTDVDNIAPFYRQADLVVFPTLMEEGFGLAAAEALACGKPVIYSDYLAIREATGGVGVPVPVGDVDALAHALTALLKDRDRRDALGRAGRAYAEAHYGWAGVYQQYQRVLERLVSSRQQG